MENSLPLTTNLFHTWKSGISVTTRQLFSHFHFIAMAIQPTNFLCPLQWNRVSTARLHLDSFPAMENSLPLTRDFSDVPVTVFRFLENSFAMQAKRVRLSYRCQQLRTNYIKYIPS